MDPQRLWAPWRLTYITGQPEEQEEAEAFDVLPGGDTDCFLCRCAASPDQRRNLVVNRGDHCVTVLNRYPYNNGHLLIAPLSHKSRLDQLSALEQQESMQTLTRMTAAIESLIRPDGFNIGLNLGRAAGAGVPGHLHWHIVPRWNGDCNFMTNIADTRVIPQSLDELWLGLSAELARTRSD